AVDGEPVPGTYASEDELYGIGRAMGEIGRGVFELASDLSPEEPELAWMERLAKETGRPVSFALLQNDLDPTQWRRLLHATPAAPGGAAAGGARAAGQVSARPTGLLVGLQSKVHPFTAHESYRALLHLPFAERVRTMRDPAVRSRMLAEEVTFHDPLTAFILT